MSSACTCACSMGKGRRSTRNPSTGIRTDRKSTRLNSSHGYISYAVFCLKKKKKHHNIISRSQSNTHRHSLITGDGKHGQARPVMQLLHHPDKAIHSVTPANRVTTHGHDH